MKDEYIRREDAIDAVKHAWAKGIEPSQYIESLEPADVISKADLITLLEQTEKDITKGVEESPTGMMIKSVFGVIKCKVNMMGEKTDG